jgi:hypothetical protein
VVVHSDNLCYGLVVLVPLLSTSHCWDAVTVRYRTILHRTEADFHRSVFLPSQAHDFAPDGAGDYLEVVICKYYAPTALVGENGGCDPTRFGQAPAIIAFSSFAAG